jgi:hypothetical protein
MRELNFFSVFIRFWTKEIRLELALKWIALIDIFIFFNSPFNYFSILITCDVSFLGAILNIHFLDAPSMHEYKSE